MTKLILFGGLMLGLAGAAAHTLPCCPFSGAEAAACCVKHEAPLPPAGGALILAAAGTMAKADGCCGGQCGDCCADGVCLCCGLSCAECCSLDGCPACGADCCGSAQAPAIAKTAASAKAMKKVCCEGCCTK